MHVFPISRGTHVKKSFEYIGELVDEGWNILLFPEGHLSPDGNMREFKGGIGLLAQSLQVPVVPVRLDGLYDAVGPDRWIPKRLSGRVRVTFGRQMKVDGKADPDAIARRFEAAIRDLAQPDENARLNDVA
jgi:long-chain acyl-CoA synthetase